MSRELETISRDRELSQIEKSTSRIMGSEDLDQEARDDAQEAISKIKSHETLCTERWEQARAATVRIELTLAVMRKALDDKIGKTPAAIIAALTGIVGWLAARAFPTH